MFRKLYIGFGALSILAYAGIALSGYELGGSSREFIPADVRHSPGGYRSFHFWHSGYHAGK